jgi:hypothetical protein
MFVHNHSLERLDAPPSDIITLLVSTNRPLVALSGPQQQADAFIVSVNRGKTQPVFLCFHIIKEGQRLIYTSNTVPTSQSARARLEGEALRFAEDMGFMMVRERLDELSADLREDAIMGLAPFAEDISQVKYEQKLAKKQKRDQAAAAESELEYEEVYEEVEEEVPIEEEPPKPEEYESLSDVVTEVSEQELPQPATDTADTALKAEPRPPLPDTTQAAREDEQAFDLGRELSDVVETIRELPRKERPAIKPRVERSIAPDPAAKRQKEPEPEADPAAEILPGKQQAIIKLLITL